MIKGKTNWFATHDFDEFICPKSGLWRGKNIKTILDKLPLDVNYLKTKMIRCNITTDSKKSGIYIKRTLVSSKSSWCWHKCIIRPEDVNNLWVHEPSNWKNLKKSAKNDIRINHYELKTKPHYHNEPPSIRYDGLHHERKIIEKNLSRFYSDDLKKYIKIIF